MAYYSTLPVGLCSSKSPRHQAILGATTRLTTLLVRRCDAPGAPPGSCRCQPDNRAPGIDDESLLGSLVGSLALPHGLIVSLRSHRSQKLHELFPISSVSRDLSTSTKTSTVYFHIYGDGNTRLIRDAIKKGPRPKISKILW